MRKLTVLQVFFLAIFSLVPFGSEFRAAEEKTAEAVPKPPGMAGDEVLTIEKAIDMVLRNNLTLRSARYDVIMTDTEYQKFIKKFSPTVGLEGGYMNQESPPSGMALFSGTKQYQWDAAASVSKLFSTGTLVSAGVKEIFYDANDQAIEFMGAQVKPEDPAYHKPSLFVSIQQELLKNSFGYTDRMLSRIYNNAKEMQRAAILNQLSGLVVGALVDYWSVTVQKAAVENAKLELETDRQLRNIIARNAQYGLAESYDLNQYNALVARAETKLEAAAQNYRETVRKFLRTINMPPETEVKGVTDLVDTLPPLDADRAVKAGFEKRVDYRNSLKELDNRKMDLKIQENNSLPSLTLSLGGNTMGQRRSFPDAMNDTAAAEYPGWNVRLKASYPLDDTEQKALLRNAYLRTKQAELAVDNLKMEIRDDILSRMERVRMQHVMLAKAKTVRAESELYYQKILVRFGQGKAKSLDMRNALDSMVQSRQQELEALVLFNVALLQFDLAKNEIFERYGVDVEKYLKMVKE